MFLMIRFERAFSRIIGKWFFSQDYLSPELLFLILFFFFVFVSLMLIAVFWPRYQAWTSRFFTIFTVLLALSSFMTTVECSPGNGGERGKGKEPLEHEGVPPELKSRDDFIEVPLSPAEQGARSTPTTGPSADPGEGEPSNAPLRRGQPEGGSALPRQLTPADLAYIHDLLFNTYPDIEQLIREIHRSDLRTHPVGEYQAAHLVDILEYKYGAERMPEILRDMQSLRRNSPYFRETLTDLEDLRASGEGTEAHLRSRAWIHPQGKR
jgi:hypothetical protein